MEPSPSPSKPARPPSGVSLHSLVVDYVINNAYANTAKVLSTIPAPGAGPSSEKMDVDDAADDGGDVEGTGPQGESPTPPPPLDDAVLESIDERRSIIDLVLSGAVVRAVQALHTHFPAVLSAEHATASSSNGGAGPSVGGATAGGTPAGGASNGNGESLRVRNGFGSSPVVVSSSSHAESHATPVFIRSSDPDHVRLNLQIQEFIESFRQLPSSAPSSPASSLGSLNGSSASNSQLTAALAALQDLHTAAKRLRSDHRAVYLQEIKDVGALFAYVDPENSPVKGFLDQARRIALAQQVNAAILRSEGRPVQSHLEQVARRTHAIYETLNDHNIDPQPSWTADAKGVDHWRIAEQLKRRPFLKGGFNLHEYVWETA